MDERSKSVLDELFARWDQYGRNYEDVVYGAAFFNNGSVWQNAKTFFAPSRKGRTPENGIRIDYGSLLIVRDRLPISEARKVIEELLEQGQLRLPEMPVVQMNASIQGTMVRHHGSHDDRFSIGFSSYEYSFNIQPGHGVNPPHGYLCKRDLPLYPHAYAAIQDYLGVRIINQGTSELSVLAPDYRAKVAEVRLARSAVSVTIESPNANQEMVIGKAYLEDKAGRKEHFDLSFNECVATFNTTEYPRNLIVVLLSSETGDVIDEWFYNPGAGLDPGAHVETNVDNLEAIIMGGESETVEFKSQVQTGLDLAITISAFANSGGGRIIVGISDNAEIVGCEPTKVQEKIVQSLDHHCNPVPAYNVVITPIREKSLVVIGVPEGTDKPYVVNGKGIYVRSGATKRRATRYETDRIYTSRGILVQQWP